jgi:hypothetical protein
MIGCDLMSIAVIRMFMACDNVTALKAINQSSKQENGMYVVWDRFGRDILIQQKIKCYGWKEKHCHSCS